ncbi:uncharacterized protein LOC129948340 [Eupeodes corollae]|uniref:uncharacterized protein LOC129948340 n=1 Tax=Eupeodes corollae TaxID=290404 RepID=UPI0024904396|nr:uncharacterized protein LOC129948340 [Eupeodes corollae]XP_055915275.1 uncharacterized protein LOC129948340 [Eupeodes corollae]XP_055915276.1 uncharacterized protein LOC129948340 [Eupeodes corollae]XP_055915279.1 uncharacterized protein LOC129948340 [Eupeodes corollae]
MSFSFNKLRSLIPGQNSSSSSNNGAKQRHSVSLEPEIGFQIFIESTPQSLPDGAAAEGVRGGGDGSVMVPELNVLLISARHLPTVFGFKIVQGYNIKVKLFPGTKRYDSSIQTNSWPKFNENFKFPLAPDKKPSIKSYMKGRRVSEFLPEELFAGHFVVFTVYALLELPPASLNRFNKTYRSLRERSSSLVQKVVDSSAKPKDDDAFAKNSKVTNSKQQETVQLTSSEAKRNIGSVTCYLEPKVFKRNTRTGQFCTDELWLPIKDITTTVLKDSNSLTQSPKGVVEIILELQDLIKDEIKDAAPTTPTDGTTVDQKPNPPVKTSNSTKISSWPGLSEVRRKMGKSNPKPEKGLLLKVSTSKMRCSNKVKDELESSAGSVYIKTTVFEHNIYLDSWKSEFFFPSLSTKWDLNVSTVTIPVKLPEDLNNILIKTTLATKNKLGKKMFLGTVIIGPTVSGSGLEHWQSVEYKRNEKIPMWHSFQ